MKRKLRILYFIHDNKKGGAAISFLDMIDSLISDIEPIVVLPHKKGFLYEQLSKKNVEIIVVYYTWWEILDVGKRVVDWIRRIIYALLYGVNSISSIVISNKIKDRDINIVHSNSSVINIGSMVAKRINKPHIWHLRELGNNELPIKPVRSSLNYRNVFNDNNSRFVAISKYAKSYYEKYIPSNKIHVIYNGISEDYNIRKPYDIHGKSINIIVVGNISKSKGQEDVVKAVALLRDRGVNRIRIIFLGGGNTTELAQTVQRYNLESSVEICGLVEDVLYYRNKANIEIIASYSEAFGRVTVEAMRSFNLVIGSDNGATKEIIDDGKTGLLYARGNIEDLANKIQWVIENPECAEVICKNAYDYSTHNFTSEQNRLSILMLYNSILQ